MQQQNQGSKIPGIEKRINKIGKPKGMNTSKPLAKTDAWSSNQQSTQVIQTLSRLGRFICFQQTGTKKPPKPDQNLQRNYKVKLNISDVPGIFLNNNQIQLAKQIGIYCEIVEKSKKNCVVFFFGFIYPEFEIIEGKPQLVNKFDKFKNYPPLLKIAPMLTEKFLNEYSLYLEYQLLGRNISELYSEQTNQNLKTAETILQCLFTKYITELKELEEPEQKKNFSSQIENYYLNFYNLLETKTQYEKGVIDLLACMQNEDDDCDQQYIQYD
ncbi:unnamed protein product (macronuclear) [Paramecium tetraurelia]|uniref:Uncharacterized protein n=1 Tax=Paramecium tetraurelia TaxID=5888 RepID=A0DAH9_PARTE|nr:uncharacterized protein GSPATT00014953001 [Paramecium tetraurelia]CAK80046.1 unnamed protein product [Paramecium tetraurelia]|eukprot:XP_001447443.1 hypothetical protein (macronuclear) [Paramecium tetraurelia strain d4-2]